MTTINRKNLIDKFANNNNSYLGYQVLNFKFSISIYDFINIEDYSISDVKVFSKFIENKVDKLLETIKCDCDNIINFSSNCAYINDTKTFDIVIECYSKLEF